MRYEALELGYPAGDAVPTNRPTGKQTGLLLCPGSTVAHITIAKTFVWMQLGKMRQGQGSTSGSIIWGPAWRRGPVNMSLPEEFDAIRVWKLKAADEPQITITVA